MKGIFRLSLVALLACVVFTAWADEKEDDKKKKKKKPVKVSVYFGHTDIDSGILDKPAFDSLVRQGLTSKDSNGRVFDVKSFMMTFCERNVYEDAEGELMFVTDYLSEYSFDSKLKDHQLTYVLEHRKKGDTIIFEHIKLQAADSTKAGANGKPFRIVVGR